MRKILWATGWLILLALVAPPFVQAGAGDVAAEDVPQPWRVIASDESGVTLELVTSSPEIALVAGPDAQLYARVEAPGYVTGGAPGQPDLPAYSALLAAPPGAGWTLEIEVLAETVIRLDAPVWPAPDYGAGDLPAVGALAAGSASISAPSQRFVIDQAAYASDSFEPASVATMHDAGYLRDVRLARLVLTPVQYRASARELRVVQRARIIVRFVGGDPLSSAAAPQADPGGFGELLRKAVLNPEQVDAWRVAPPGLGAASAAQPGAAALGELRYRIIVREAGIYRLTYDMLAAAGLPLAEVDPRHLSVYHGSDELAIEVAGEADGRFDPPDEVRFYAEQVESLYTGTNTYWLVLRAENGRRMTQRTVAPQNAQAETSFAATQRFEENHIYRSNLPTKSGVDHWYWGQMYVIGMTRAPTMTLPFTIEHVLPTGLAVITPELWGASSDASVAPDHLVLVSVNGTQIGSVAWDGVTGVRQELSFDQALLREGGNVLTLDTPGETGARDSGGRSWESNWPNWFSLKYQKALRASGDRLDFTPAPGAAEWLTEGWSAPDVFFYDVTDADSPVRLTGASPGAPGDATLRLADTAPANGRYHAVTLPAMRLPEAISEASPSDLRNPADGADYLLIAHADFIPGVSPLVQLRRDQGLRVRVVDIQDIYDEFSVGLLDPWAIRDFIQYAYYNWPGPPPAYVLLVGDGSYDFMDYEGSGVKTFIPPLLEYVDPILGETAADNRFVAVVGEDVMPDMHLGRLPVNNQGELAAVVNKIVAYELNPASGPWRTRAVFVADNPDVGGQFGTYSDAAVAEVPPEIEITKIYLGSAEFPANQALRAQQATLDAFNRGALFFNYVGHSSISNWAAELLFGINALPQIRNGSYTPIMLPMTCLEGTFHNPRFAGVSESVLRLSSGGAVASWGPTGFGVATGHDYLHTGFYEAIFDAGAWDLGLATTAAKLNLYTNARYPGGAPRFHDLLDTYNLLGDPATRFGLPAADLDIEATAPAGALGPADAVTLTVSYRNAGAARIKHVVVTAELPAALTDLAWSSGDPGLKLRPGTRLTWDLAEMAPGAAGIITIAGRIPSDIAPEELPLSVEMSIASPWLEPDLTNNVAGPFVLNLLPADLLLVQTTEPLGKVAPGEWLTITLSYANLGPAPAAGVTLTLPLLAELDAVRITQLGPAATLRPGAHYTWELGTLSAGSKGRIIVSGRMPSNLTIDQLAWSISGRLAAPWPDSDPTNNAAEPDLIRVDIGDPFEPDNTRETARRLPVPVFDQPHSYDPLGDQDWVVFRAQAGVRYTIRTVDLVGGGDTVLFLWDAAGRLVAKNDDAAFGTRFSEIHWVADSDQDYTAMVTSTSLAPGFTYGIEIVALPQSVFLPALAK